MPQKFPHPRANTLLDSLSPEQRFQFTQHAEMVMLAAGQVLATPERPITHVHFPTTAVLSVLSVIDEKTAVETGVVGYEGLSPLAAFHQLDEVNERIIVQVPGESLRMVLGAFHAAVAEAPAIVIALHHYAQALFTQLAQSSACNRQHSVIQRCARWLLMTHDRVPHDEFELTHLFLSRLLGVRRSSVTLAFEALRESGAITYTRGRVKVMDRPILREHSCDCHTIVRGAYDRILLSRRGAPGPLVSTPMSQGQPSRAAGVERPLQARGLSQ